MCFSIMVRRDLDALGLDWDARVDTNLYGALLDLKTEKLKAVCELAADGRIFPNSFAPVIIEKDGKRLIVPMRYQVWPSGPAYKTDPQHLSLFNARKDNLLKPGGLWRNLLGKKHGLLVFHRFYEWVEVRDLVAAGTVTLEEVKKRFELQELEKKKKALAAGKPYRPSPTAKKPAIERKIEICFTPRDKQVIWTPVLYDERTLESGHVLRSFAVITDEPTPEVAAAGHDRSPIFLRRDAVDAWLNPKGLTQQQCIELLGQVDRMYFEHRLPEAA